MTRLVLKDPLLDFQVLRAAGSAPYGGADVGECIATARRIKQGEPDSWHGEWVATAEASAALASHAEEAGERETARLAYLRASTYYRTACVMLLRPPRDPRLRETNAKQTEMFRRAAALMAQPPETLEISFEQTTLPGYFFRAADDRQPGATLILTGGYDSTVEELYFNNAAAGLARGYNVLAFDGPGRRLLPAGHLHPPGLPRRRRKRRPRPARMRPPGPCERGPGAHRAALPPRAPSPPGAAHSRRRSPWQALGGVDAAVDRLPAALELFVFVGHASERRRSRLLDRVCSHISVARPADRCRAIWTTRRSARHGRLPRRM